MIDQSTDEAARKEHIKQLMEANNWRPERVYGSITVAHYHPNVHEAYAVLAGSSRLCLGQDVTIEQTTIDNERGDNFVEVNLNTGDVIVIPAGVAHCSKTYSPQYRYLASYPKEGEYWRLVQKTHIDRVENYDNLKDVAVSQNVLMPTADPVFGLESGGLLDLWDRLAWNDRQIRLAK
ncbi:CIC11C00000000480 [Sungouiella intermedia]|uniref:CIC11C00000000480 n=1 Tax=Sungouiella intermedia TaxID=45354 RepID=A0A1L0DJJ2_9ASCO|nr:CIC11C00000000480 [[Candida] intermedia]